jgi:pyroglutamyl-peptidase
LPGAGATSASRRGRNAISLLFPDASGYRPKRGVIAPGEPAALRGAAPFARLLGAVRSSAVPARLSRDAGRYLCNYAYWRALEQARGGRPLVQFIHIPRILSGSRRRRRGRRPLRLDTLVAAGERLLIALIAASRR